MNHNVALSRIAATLVAGETIKVTVTQARGRTLGLDFEVTRDGYSMVGQRWSRQGSGVYGTLRSTYAARVLGR